MKSSYQRDQYIIHIKEKKTLKKTKNSMAPFYGWGSTASRLEPLRGDSLLFTTKFPEIPDTHFIDLERMKGWVDLEATEWFFENGTPGLRIQGLNHQAKCQNNNICTVEVKPSEKVDTFQWKFFLRNCFCTFLYFVFRK